MSESEKRRGEKTREAILDAAEIVFAEHGFDGARVDTIAEVAGYNKTLIFRYFGDKSGLYAEVLKRVDEQLNAIQIDQPQALLENEDIVSDAHRFRAFLTAIVSSLFDFIVARPRVMRMLVWEHAEGWQTFSKVISQFNTEDIAQIEAIFTKAQRAGWLRTDFEPMVLLLLAEQICWSYPTSLPFYQMVLPGRDLTSATAQARAREQLIEFIVSGLMIDPQNTRETTS